MPFHHQLVGYARDLDELTLALWMESARAILQATGSELAPDKVRDLAHATFAAEHPEANQRLALWQAGYTGDPAPGSTLAQNQAEAPRPLAYAQQQALAAVVDPGDPDSGISRPLQMGGWS